MVYNSQNNKMFCGNQGFSNVSVIQCAPPEEIRYLVTGWNWFSFPVLDTVTIVNMDALEVLAPILDNMEEVLFESEVHVIWWNPQIPGWQNDIGDFRSVDGYKIWMNAEAELPITGFLEDPYAVISLDAEAEYGNWIGYYLPYSQSPEDAFANVWNDLTYIQADGWGMIRDSDEEWKGSRDDLSVDYGKLYIVGVERDAPFFTWNDGGIAREEYTKTETSVFTYEEDSDYMMIFVDSTDNIAGVDEIGVFLDDECIGASVVEKFPIFIPAYIDDDSTQTKGGNELTFQVANYGKSGGKTITAFVYNEIKDAFVQEPILLDDQDYAIVRLGTGAGVEFPKEFTLYQNYPNPFSYNFGKSTTTISFMPSPEAENSEIRIYNTKGQLVKQFKIQNSKNAINEVAWDGKDDHGTQLGNGIYFYKVISGKKSAIKKMVILR